MIGIGRIGGAYLETMFCRTALQQSIAHLRTCEKCRRGLQEALTAFPIIAMAGVPDVDTILDAIESSLTKEGGNNGQK